MSARASRGLVLLPALVAALAGGCASSRRAAVPAGMEQRAVLPGYPESIRYFPRDALDVQEFRQDLLDSWKREQASLASQGHTGPLPAAAYLSISGGGDNGAFGAGFLCGWTKSGTRPAFKFVTGISTGALIAPFAFLGSGYDGTLEQLYTGISRADVAKERSIFAILFQDAVADSAPLRHLVEKHFTPQIMEAIAAEHEKGRVLLIGTTNLDARRPVLWNVTKIAALRRPGALELVRSILLASAAIPGTFPPVMIDVEEGGRPYQEMHVDGGTVAQAFVYPAAVRLGDFSREQGFLRERKLYLIRNARLDPEWSQVERRTLPIIRRAILTLIHYQGYGDLYRIYAVTRRDSVEYNLAFIPPSFQTPHRTEFDKAYMGELFRLGDSLAAAGYSWHKEPPVLLSGEDRTLPEAP